MITSPSFNAARAGLSMLAMLAASVLAGLWVSPYWGVTSVDLMFLPAVLATAALFGRWPALIAAVMSALAYNYFFVVPLHSLRIDRPEDLLTIVILLVVALVVSQLAAAMRAQTQLALAHAKRNATIAGLARRLLSCTDRDEIATVAVTEISRLFHCRAVFAVGRETPQIVASAPDPTTLTASDLAAAALAMVNGEVVGRGVRRASLADWQFHPVTPADTAIASLGLARDDGAPPISDDQLPLLGNLLDQVALALERARLDREARDVIVIRERDRMRSILLASTGEEIKPRLNAIAAAARGLRREATGDRTLISNIAADAASLAQFIDNLVHLDAGSDQEPIEIGDVTIDLHKRVVRRNGEAVHLTPKEYAVFAELARNTGRVLTHEYLLKSIWGPAHAEHIDYLRVAVRALRQKLEREPSNPEMIINEPAVGYRLKTP